jgi:hypothetical protein
MKLANHLAGAGVALMLSLAAPLSWGQTTEPGLVGSTAIAPKATSPTVPPERVAPGVPGIPANTAKPAGPFAGGLHQDALTSDYVAKKIADAGARGKDVTKAKSEEAKGNAALKKGMNDEAARHFDSALRLIADHPARVGGTATGPGNSKHVPMPSAVTPADQPMPGKVTPVEARRG